MKPFNIRNIEINPLFGHMSYVIIQAVMGQITIEIPQSVNRSYRIVSEDSAKKVLSKLEILLKEENKIEDDEILGLWADREEPAEEIAKELRRKSNDRSAKKESRMLFTKQN